MNKFIYKRKIPDTLDVQICKLSSMKHINPCYWLTSYNLVWDDKSHKYPTIGILNVGYPYVSLRTRKAGEHACSTTLHKIIALARIKNAPYTLIEHLDDNPLNLRLENLLFSDHKNNIYRATDNGHRCYPEAKFCAVFADGSSFTGSMKEISETADVSLSSLYDRYYKGPVSLSDTPYHLWERIRVVSVFRIEDMSEMIYHRHRLIDYRNAYGSEIPIHFDNLDVIVT